MQSGAQFPLTPALSLGERERLSTACEDSLESEYFPALLMILPAPEPAFKDGKDAFHRVPFILGEVRDAVERVLTRFRGAKRVKMSGDSLPEGEGWGEGEGTVPSTMCPRIPLTVRR